MTSILVLGAGAWGTTIAKVLAENGHQTQIWCHESGTADQINQTHLNSIFLPEIKLPSSLKATSDLDAALRSDALIVAIPSTFINTLKKIKLPKKIPILILTKGLCEQKSYLFISDYIHSIWRCTDRLAVLSGPNLAKEIALGLPAASVIAADDSKVAIFFQNLIKCPYFRIYTSDDRRGVEAGGILKNVIAIAAGIVDGIHLGSNAKSALIARGLQEMIRFGTAFGAQERTFYGLSGLGDLCTTCMSSLSRNWSVGFQLGQGKSLPEILSGKSSVAEGIRTAQRIFPIAKERHLDIPITSEVYHILFDKKNPKKSISDLLDRKLKNEL